MGAIEEKECLIILRPLTMNRFQFAFYLGVIRAVGMVLFSSPLDISMILAKERTCPVMQGHCFGDILVYTNLLQPERSRLGSLRREDTYLRLQKNQTVRWLLSSACQRKRSWKKTWDASTCSQP